MDLTFPWCDLEFFHYFYTFLTLEAEETSPCLEFQEIYFPPGILVKCHKGTSKNQDFFCEGKEAARGKPECMSEYMRAHGAKSTMFVRAGGQEHAADTAITEKDGF